MQRLAILVFVLSAGAVGWVAAELDGRRNAEAYQQKSFSGSVSVGRTQVGFSMPAGYTVKGKLGSPRVFSDTRENRFVPDTYGPVLTITAHGDDAVLWFKDSAGSIRNVTLPAANRRLYALQTQKATVRQINRKSGKH